MQTSSFRPLQPLLLPPPFSGNFTSPKRQPSPRKTTSTSPSPRAMKREKGHDDHKLVDENMIVLKMRIQEIKRKEEENQATTTPNSWMEWEKQWCKNYESDVYEVVGFLQVLLMNTRPSLVLGLLALLMFSTSTSLALALRSLLGFAM
ncbi:hypothetical protein Salat_1329300 [Sesamum alatum]|uniref:Uncharacterized protein n=1 Tax=Sesamum alatum TaxID=300844 RepID=A0AAE1YHG8_9LAMI|nr:hypothetical protein Salat_1329300 [Sesamum alatum]